jgi:hypothetical protein
VSDFEAGLAEGFRRGYQAAMDAVALQQETAQEKERARHEYR